VKPAFSSNCLSVAVAWNGVGEALMKSIRFWLSFVLVMVFHWSAALSLTLPGALEYGAPLFVV
jgi:hypothetical protein